MSVSAEIVANRRRWVDALESGRWPQAFGHLRGEGRGRCCLGVACSVSGLGGWDRPAAAYRVPGWGGATGTLPDPVADMLGLPVADDKTHQNAQVELTSRNDGGEEYAPDGSSRPWTLAEIADLLRSPEWFGPDLDREVA